MIPKPSLHDAGFVRAVLGAAAVLATMVLGMAPLDTSAQRAARVKVDAVRNEPLSQTVPILGRMIAREQGEVAAAVAGPLKSILVQVGDRVTKGDLMAEIESDVREAAIARVESERNMQQARLQSATAQLELTRDEMQRLQKLEGTSAFPRKQYEDQRHQVVRYTSELAEARAALERSESEIRTANIELRRTQIRAPYDAVVTRRHVSAGAYLRLGDALVTLLNDTDLEVEADVPANRVGGLSPGTVLKSSFEDGTAFASEVRAVIPDENPLTRTRQVRLTPTIDGRADVAVNQSVTVHVPVGKSRTVVSVHKDAVINRKGQQLVYVVVEGKATIRPVQLGEAVGARLEVLKGLNPGEQVVVRGNERLRPGQAVEPS